MIIDISNPSSPVLKRNYDTRGYVADVSVSDSYVYVAEGVNGLVILKANPGKTSSLFADFSSNITSGCAPLSVQFNITVLETTGSDEGSSDRDEEKSAGIISRKETGNLTKESKKTPEFTIIYGVISLLAAFYIMEIKKVRN
ncbi:hypothetical protein ASJ81_16355 [Methanosarcina spelaei]|uniref:Uncharacterized protein n=1 Tax=Methanosarcina spelaei TaxID=1036679 RepID=A0A2A2HWG3_9EURY|nr:hypothetical protein [Methanosarcina spelaei]PAV13807.1 hypothetical protein ASJ81_16355 [Methanosarcina spelaei]